MNKLIILIVLSFFMFTACSSGDNAQEATQQSGTPSLSATVQAGEITYMAPAEWIKETPSSSMRKDQYSLPGAGGFAPGELTVFFFPGGGGSVDMNLERWYGQFKQPDGSSTKTKAKIEKKNVNNIPVTIVTFDGTYLKSSMGDMMAGGKIDEFPGYSFIAAIAETSKGPWFFKLAGPKKTISESRDAFDKFVESFEVK